MFQKKRSRRYRLLNKKNKLVALGIILIHIPLMMIEKDATMFVISVSIGVPLFFANENYIY